MALTKTLTGFRYVQINRGDTLQRIAQREIGEASRWVDLIAINDLSYPYLTDDPTLAGPHVKLYGETLVVPATSAQTTGAIDADLVFGRDLALVKGLLAAEGGDLQLVSGVANLRQAYEGRIKTPLAELVYHPTYGCGVHAMKGRAGQAGVATLSAQYVRSSLAADSRTQRVVSASATLTGDAVVVQASVQPVTGASVDIQLPV